MQVNWLVFLGTVRFQRLLFLALFLVPIQGLAKDIADLGSDPFNSKPTQPLANQVKKRSNIFSDFGIDIGLSAQNSTLTVRGQSTSKILGQSNTMSRFMPYISISSGYKRWGDSRFGYKFLVTSDWFASDKQLVDGNRVSLGSENGGFRAGLKGLMGYKTSFLEESRNTLNLFFGAGLGLTYIKAGGDIQLTEQSGQPYLDFDFDRLGVIFPAFTLEIKWRNWKLLANAEQANVETNLNKFAFSGFQVGMAYVFDDESFVVHTQSMAKKSKRDWKYSSKSKAIRLSTISRSLPLLNNLEVFNEPQKASSGIGLGFEYRPKESPLSALVDILGYKGEVQAQSAAFGLGLQIANLEVELYELKLGTRATWGQGWVVNPFFNGGFSIVYANAKLQTLTLIRSDSGVDLASWVGIGLNINLTKSVSASMEFQVNSLSVKYLDIFEELYSGLAQFTLNYRY